jgi:hypothetical protein
MSRILAKVQLFTKCQVPTAAVARSTTIRRRSKSNYNYNYNYNYNCNCNCNDNGKINCTATATEWVLLQQSIGSLRGHLPVLMAHQALCGGDTSILYSYELVAGRILHGNGFLLLGCAGRDHLAPRTPKKVGKPARRGD